LRFESASGMANSEVKYWVQQTDEGGSSRPGS
jgi:hypothetical protein